MASSLDFLSAMVELYNTKFNTKVEFVQLPFDLKEIPQNPQEPFWDNLSLAQQKQVARYALRLTTEGGFENLSFQTLLQSGALLLFPGLFLLKDVISFAEGLKTLEKTLIRFYNLEIVSDLLLKKQQIQKTPSHLGFILLTRFFQEGGACEKRAFRLHCEYVNNVKIFSKDIKHIIKQSFPETMLPKNHPSYLSLRKLGRLLSLYLMHTAYRYEIGSYLSHKFSPLKKANKGLEHVRVSSFKEFYPLLNEIYLVNPLLPPRVATALQAHRKIINIKNVYPKRTSK